MVSIGAVSFLSGWLLAALALLPVLWWLLRAVPPAPARRLFPGVRLLIGLQDPERMPERTPWWLLLLRMLALAAAILAFAQPVLNPQMRQDSAGPVLVVMDGGWASAPQWSAREARVAEILDNAARDGRPAAVISLADPLPGDATIPFRDAGDWAQRLTGIAPQPWAPDRAGFADWLTGSEDTGFETWWFTDGLAT
ncbi:MAG: BatA domain-containing protein, partial [Pseudomonadota bacterium]